MRQPPPKRSNYYRRRQHRHRPNPVPSHDVQIDETVLIALGLPVAGLLGVIMYAAPVLMLAIGAVAGLAAASVIVPYLVIWIVTTVLERWEIARGQLTTVAETGLSSEASQDDN